MKIPNETTSFHDFVEYGDLEIAIQESDSFTEVEVERPYANVGLEEKWFINSLNGEVSITKTPTVILSHIFNSDAFRGNEGRCLDKL
ncbi:hypothetical protein EDC56_3542 [Sinobacterium caligoides]|uniref:Uncharacterized protein n=1 Tax=Sinobacterium caligoides TaxID=933926 RepID=A0A3N2DDK2_9GAMM|nr:hypothetical protein [Sinobacterium caligoides]ROR97875.1 hypothetical protein EDC56_3542 [Sinobacterium caligoides]